MPKLPVIWAEPVNGKVSPLLFNAKEAVTAWDAEITVPSILAEFTYDAVFAVITAPSTLAPAT